MKRLGEVNPEYVTAMCSFIFSVIAYIIFSFILHMSGVLSVLLTVLIFVAGMLLAQWSYVRELKPGKFLVDNNGQVLLENKGEKAIPYWKSIAYYQSSEMYYLKTVDSRVGFTYKVDNLIRNFDIGVCIVFMPDAQQTLRIYRLENSIPQLVQYWFYEYLKQHGDMNVFNKFNNPVNTTQQHDFSMLLVRPLREFLKTWNIDPRSIEIDFNFIRNH